MRNAVSCLAALLVTGALAGAGSAAVPGDLVKELLKAQYPDSSLPAAFSSARIASQSLPGTARTDGAVGEVEVDLDSPDPNSGAIFIVFRSAAGAAADLAHAGAGRAGVQLHATGKVSGFAASAAFAGSVMQTDALNDTTTEQVTLLVVQKGNVLVGGFTYSQAPAGNTHGAFELLRSALAHLDQLPGHP